MASAARSRGREAQVHEETEAMVGFFRRKRSIEQMHSELTT